MSRSKITTLQKHQRRVRNLTDQYEEKLETCHNLTENLMKQYKEATKHISKLIGEMSKTEEKMHRILEAKNAVDDELADLRNKWGVLKLNNDACTEASKRYSKNADTCNEKLVKCEQKVRTGGKKMEW